MYFHFGAVAKEEEKNRYRRIQASGNSSRDFITIVTFIVGQWNVMAFNKENPTNTTFFAMFVNRFAV